MSHKNLKRLMQSFVVLKKYYPNLKLVLTGKPVPGYINMTKVVGLLGIEKSVLFPGYVPQQLLPALYAEAACFVFPSLYEGFGLPPLEAAACGVPVVASSVSSVPEVMAKAAEYVNPEYVPDIVRGVRRVLDDQQYRRQLVISGQHRARQFSWKACAEQTQEVYRQVLQKT
jgi:glycosyltransferase involved in cell wall biosynthesis